MESAPLGNMAKRAFVKTARVGPSVLKARHSKMRVQTVLRVSFQMQANHSVQIAQLGGTNKIAHVRIARLDFFRMTRVLQSVNNVPLDSFLRQVWWSALPVGTTGI